MSNEGKGFFLPSTHFKTFKHMSLHFKFNKSSLVIYFQQPKKFPFFETGNPNPKQHFGFFRDIERKQMKIKTTPPGHYFALNCKIFAWYIKNGQ